MYLSQLILTNYKNYSQQAVSFVPGLNCFVGMNGVGKTNLLDAIYYLCICKSYFGLNDRNIVQHGAEFFRLEGQFLGRDRNEQLVIKVQPGKLKSIEKNRIVYDRIADHIGCFPVVMIAPDDTVIVREGSELRRRFLDNSLSQINSEYLYNLLQYNRILRQRNAALKQFGQSMQFNEALIGAYNEQMIAPGTFIFNQRKAFVKAFVSVFESYYHKISGGKESVQCQYVSQLNNADFKDLLDRSLENDKILFRTSVGVQKDELKFIIGGHAVKRFASQGQLKSFILALKLAQYEILRIQKGVQPILLLDDIFDKLDSSRVQSLLQLLVEESVGQIFITDTDEKRIETLVNKLDLPHIIFKILAGPVINP